MRRDLLQAIMMSAGIGAFMPPQRNTIQVVEDPQHTKNLFGPISEVAGKTLEVLSRNPDGDCLCLFTGVKGQNIVDVDHRDVAKP
jgi:hypothetical protein